MNLFNRISIAIRAAAHDLVSSPPAAPADQSAALLKTAQQRVDRLNQTLAQAEAREKRAEQDWRDARAQADALEAEANAAVRAGQAAGVARVKLAQFNQAQNKVLQLSDGWKICATTSEKLRIELQDLQAQLTAIRRRLGQADSAAHPTTEQARQRLAQTDRPAEVTSKPATTLSTPKSAEAPPADKGLDQARIADLLKKRAQG